MDIQTRLHQAEALRDEWVKNGRPLFPLAPDQWNFRKDNRDLIKAEGELESIRREMHEQGYPTTWKYYGHRSVDNFHLNHLTEDL